MTKNGGVVRGRIRFGSDELQIFDVRIFVSLKRLFAPLLTNAVNARQTESNSPPELRRRFSSRRAYVRVATRFDMKTGIARFLYYRDARPECILTLTYYVVYYYLEKLVGRRTKNLAESKLNKKQNSERAGPLRKLVRMLSLARIFILIR